MNACRSRHPTKVFQLSFLLSCLGVAAGLLGFPKVGALRAESPPTGKTPAKTYEVRTILDVTYCDGAEADKERHKLDLYLPKGTKDFPVLFFLPGGAWTIGDKTFYGAFSDMGPFWARHGVGYVVPNYRLSPAVKHPEHIKDVARAFAWTYKNIAGYGGRADEIFVGGHSAGGHLCALLATEDSYLKAEGLSLKAIKGVIPMSGVFTIDATSPVFDSIFGPDPKVRKEASPASHAGPGLPPFLIIYADHDLPYCDKPAAEKFFEALKDKKDAVQILEVPHRNHLSIFLDASRENDPVAKAMEEFIASTVGSGNGEKSTRKTGE